MSANSDRVFLALGGNLGDRMAVLRAAVDSVGELPGTRVCAVSSVYESEPWGVADQPRFLNAAAEIETELLPLELLTAVKDIERRLGREPGPKWGPRVIDIDIILWGGQVRSGPELSLPHPEFRRRAFVLEPLVEIAAAVVDPASGMTIAELVRRPEVEGKAWRVGRIGGRG